KAQSEAEGDVRQKKEERDAEALDGRVAELRARLGADPLHAERDLWHLVRAELPAEAVEELIALRLELDLDLVIALAHHDRVVVPGAELDPRGPRELGADRG